MKLVLQRVIQAAVKEVAPAGREVAAVGRGILIFIGIEKGDSPDLAMHLAKRVASFRIFEDDQGKMNRSVQEVQGQVLVVSQFTLAADLTKGNRPSFDPAEDPKKAQALIELFVESLKAFGIRVSQGRFGARMEVNLTNDGPATFLM